MHGNGESIQEPFHGVVIARLCALVSAEYPQFRPETIRAIVVHSARWPTAMRSALNAAGDGKRARSQLVRRYGFGVPSQERALRSAADALTLVGPRDAPAVRASSARCISTG